MDLLPALLILQQIQTFFQSGWYLYGKNIQIPCVGLKVCPIFKQKIESENISDNNDQKAKYRPRYICSECFNSHGGHFNERQGRGHVNYECKDRHKNDTSEALRIIGCWILSMAGTNDENNKNNLLTCLTNMLLTYHNIKSSVVVNYPSLFFIKMALRLLHIDITKIMNHQYKITPETANEFGKTLGNVTWRTRHDVEKNKTKLENPSSLTEYQNGFPSFLTDFFNGFIETLQRKKYEILTRKRKQRGLSLKNFDTSCVNKITVFLTSMILNIAFPNTKIWLTHIMSSLCRNPKLHHSLYNILCIANVVSHTYRYERLLEKARQQVVSPESRLLRNTNIWNISVIDNIDFIEQTYAYGNIFDTTRRSVHATLRMVFQFTLPMQIQHCSPINIKAFNGNNLSIFGTSDFTNNLLSLYEEMFQNFLTTRADDWDADNILKEIAQKIPMGCKVPHPNVIILKPGDNPNCNVNVHNACDMYYGDVGIVNTGCLDIACDEAIFRRLISYKDDNIDKNVRPLLGQWHTSRDMCIVLINVFSGYGIANMAAKLGVRFLDKLEKVVDYQATCRVLELIWVAVGIAIFKYLNNKNLTISDIKSGNNNILKVWYHYLCWAGYWIGHKIGIRRGNYEMQIRNLKAFSPLFPVTGKSNYARSVVYFLTYVEHDPHLQELLKCVCSVNLTQPGHYFAFDEALERFGVKFVKQNIGGKIVSDEELSLQISSVQTERERLDLLISEYIGDTVVVREERAVQSRKEVLWQLANELLSAFSLEDPKMHDIFLNAPEITSIGFSKLFTCYDNGIPRLIDIQKQDVYQKVSRNTIGRRKHDVGVHKLSENQSKEMRKQRINRNLTVDQVEDNTTEQQEGLATEHKRQYRITKDNEKEILENLFKSKSDSFPQDEAIEVLRQLQDSSKDWNMQRVRNYWNNHHKRK